MSEATVTVIPTDAAGLASLRAAFPPETVGKLPRVTCKDCSDRSKNCQTHKKQKCAECGNFVSTAHIHLDYVGHAEVTDRLLTVDPGWSWEPVAFDERGLPAVNKTGNEWTFWIRLTVCGVTRLGVGSVAPNAFDAEKQLIGDALRNASMRFGVALELWAKEELESTLDAPPMVDRATGEITGGVHAPPEGAPVVPDPQAPASVTTRPPPARAKRTAPAAPATAETGAQAPQGTITAAALDSLLGYAARKKLTKEQLTEMAGKALDMLTMDESQELTTKVTAHKADA